MSDETIEVGNFAERARPLKVRVSVVAGPHKGWEVVIAKPCSLTIGRGPEASIRLKDEQQLSRVHARLDISATEVRLFDLGSTNGTLLNGFEVSEAIVGEDDTFGVGDTLLTARIESKGDAVADILPTQLFSSAGDQNAGDAESTKPVPSKPEPIMSIGDYRLVREIGRGGMAAVYEAIHEPSSQVVAIKMIREEVRGQEKLRQMFAREASIISQLQHPFIVRARHLGFSKDHMYLVMDYVPCIDYAELLNRQTPRERVRISVWTMTRVLEALEYAHQKGVVHRDVKPSNILAFREGKHVKVRLSDFGLAKFFEDAGLGGLTEDLSIRGTMGFMAPEQFRNAKTVGPAADIYAAGACLYHYLTGKFPQYSHGSAPALQADAMQGIPEPLVAAVLCATQPDPKQRFLKAADFITAIRAFAEKAKDGSV